MVGPARIPNPVRGRGERGEKGEPQEASAYGKLDPVPYSVHRVHTAAYNRATRQCCTMMAKAKAEAAE